MQAEHLRTSIRSLVDQIQDEALLTACHELIKQLAAVQDRLGAAEAAYSDPEAGPAHAALLHLTRLEEQEYAVSIW